MLCFLLITLFAHNNTNAPFFAIALASIDKARIKEVVKGINLIVKLL